MTKKYDEAGQRFGRVLHRQRRMTGMTQERLSRTLGISSSYLSNIERGRKPPTGQLLAAMDHALETGGKLTRLWEELSDNGQPAWLGVLADLEREATMILECQTHVIPPLLQTEAYAHKIATDVAPWSTDGEIQASIAAKMERGRWFANSAIPVYWAVIEETVIRRRVGSYTIMREQLAYVLEKVRSARVKLQVIPLENASHPTLSGSFKIISTESSPDVVYAESIHSGQIVDDPAYVANYRLLYGAIQASALPPEPSLRLIEEELEGLPDEQ
jgi:transcriptional regulator with XRE-family HTH domain